MDMVGWEDYITGVHIEDEVDIIQNEDELREGEHNGYFKEYRIWYRLLSSYFVAVFQILEMRGSSKIVLHLFFFLFAKVIAEINECKESRCHNGPAIRYPFWLNGHQPDHCGSPGFELSCTKKNQTMLNLSYSVKFLVKEINYRSMEIHVHDPDHCHLKELLSLNISASPFQFKEENQEHYSLFNCSSTRTHPYYQYSIPCLSVPGYPIYVVPSSPLSSLNLSYCRKIKNFSLPHSMFDQENIFSLDWSKRICGNCSAESKKCSLKSNSKEPEIICFDKAPKGAILGFFLLVLVVIALYCVYSSDKIEKGNQLKIEKFLEDYRALKPSRYSYADIKKITNQFKDKLGQGGYGTVYKGKLSNEILVAVKILNNSTGNGEEFINEVGTMGRIHHINVVRLVGFCADGLRRALIYEFLPNESLEKFIFSAAMKNQLLGWEKLRDIALGIAKGIEYLHQGCDQRILHFDIKPHNILLDQNLNPKISDFGLAKLCSKEKSVVSMSAARGTMGYIAPEVLSRNFGNVSHKSDVYSFGMLLLEMVGGRRNIDVTVENTSQVYFPEWVYNHLDQGEELHIRIEKEGDAKMAKQLTIVGLWCIQWYPKDRPSMKVVVQMLEGEGDNLTMPSNPFISMGPTRTNGRRLERPLQQELAVISELE
ncbi:Rust resistance kinase Lr10 [Vitis vinifera]|uniref:Rust resistance kinase Lr10 n=1 Tax=Vitis vinifera TaxID=29760 RepID=A0A438CHE8_VITVI|nr:Rust resistance kinase Lr10 [Vitis vinifera]